MFDKQITVEDILTSDGQHPDRAAVADSAVRNAATVLAVRVNNLLVLFNARPDITSGYRTPAANKAAGGAKRSAHLEGRAVDLRDPMGLLASWCLAHLRDLETFGLWMESPTVTKGWCHLQSRPVGERVFMP